MKELADRLAAINAPISEEDQIVTLLRSLPSSYSILVTALEARDAITLSYVQQALIREEQRLKGESKAGGSAATGQTLLGKQTEKAENLTRRRHVSCAEKLVISAEKVQEISRCRSPSTKPSLQSKGSYVDLECDTDERAFGTSAMPGDSKGWIVDSGASSHMAPIREI